MKNLDLNPNEAEDIVIGQVLYEPDCISRASRVVKADHFFGHPHKVVFSKAMELWRAGTPVDLVTMYHALHKSGSLDLVGGPHKLAEWTYRVAQTIHLEHHCAIVRECYNLRTLRDAGLGLAESANISADPEELIGHMTADIAKASNVDVTTDVNAAERAYELMNNERPKPDYLLMAGVDDYVFILPGNVVTVSAPSGIGKTAFALCAMRNLAPKRKPWFVSLEMSASELTTRLMCMVACVDIDNALNDRLSEAEKVRMSQVLRTHPELFNSLDIEDSGHMSIDMFKAKAEHKVKNEGVGFIVVDYAQLMEADRKMYPGETLQNEAISKGIRATARSLNVPILLVVHLNRQGEAHGSTQYEKDAHVRMKLSREPGANVMQVDIVKNRNGKTGQVFTPCSMQFGLIGSNPPYPF